MLNHLASSLWDSSISTILYNRYDALHIAIGIVYYSSLLPSNKVHSSYWIVGCGEKWPRKGWEANSRLIKVYILVILLNISVAKAHAFQELYTALNWSLDPNIYLIIIYIYIDKHWFSRQGLPTIHYTTQHALSRRHYNDRKKQYLCYAPRATSGFKWRRTVLMETYLHRRKKCR